MKRFFLHLPCLALLLTAAWTLVSCSDDTEEQQPEEERYGTYMRVTVRVRDDRSGTATRATGPAGGEDGDGREPGDYNENHVYNATLLLYRDPEGINSVENPIMEFALYAPKMYEVDGSGGKVYTSDLLRYKTTLPRGEFHVIALVNVGDRTDLEGKTLAAVRDMTVDTPYRLQYDDVTGMPLDISKADNFVMTSAEDYSFVLGDLSGIDHAINVSVPVERMAARLDFSPGKLAETLPADGSAAVWFEGTVPVEDGGTTMDTPLRGYRYVVLNASEKTPTRDRFILTGVTPFNCLASGTYFIKRVENKLEGGNLELVYLGREEADAAGNAVNRVLDPWTPAKENVTEEPDGILFRRRLTNAYDPIDEEIRWPVKNTDMFTPTVANDDGLRYYTLDYTQENTLPPGHGKERYATGLFISGYYGSADAEGNIAKYIPQNYHYYIRHADPTGSTNEALPMKYGIVRNNIYRIHISSVNSLGQIQIVVNDWRRIDVPEIQI